MTEETTQAPVKVSDMIRVTARVITMEQANEPDTTAQ